MFSFLTCVKYTVHKLCNNIPFPCLESWEIVHPDWLLIGPFFCDMDRSSRLLVSALQFWAILLPNLARDQLELRTLGIRLNQITSAYFHVFLGDWLFAVFFFLLHANANPHLKHILEENNYWASLVHNKKNSTLGLYTWTVACRLSPYIQDLGQRFSQKGAPSW